MSEIPEHPEQPASRTAQWIARGEAWMEHLEHQRPRHQTVEIGFRWVQRDKQIAGGVLGGGLAYRFFFWSLSLALLFSGGLGIAAHEHADIAAAGSETGLTGSVTHSIQSAAEQSDSGRWWLILVGTYVTLWFSFALLRALRMVHAAAWQITVPPLRDAPKALGVVLVSPVVLVLGAILAGYMRANAGPAPGLLVTLVVGAVFAGMWLWASMKLPSPDLPWTAFLPGAVFAGVGIEALHLFTVYFLANRLASASALYGVLGLATTALFYLFLIGRGVVWAAELNAVTWEVMHGGVPE